MAGNLDEYLKHFKCSEDDVKRIMRQVLAGLAFMHAQGIVHFDLKPQNLLLSDDSCRTIKIADFGFATCLVEPQPVDFPIKVSLYIYICCAHTPTCTHTHTHVHTRTHHDIDDFEV